MTKRLWLYVLAGTSVLVLAGVATAVGIAVARGDRQPLSLPTPSVLMSATREPLGAGTCVVLLPLLSTSATGVTAVFQDPSHDTTALDSTAGQLEALETAAPGDWRGDIATQRKTLDQVVAAKGDRTKLLVIDLHAFEDSGVRLAEGCRRYTA